MKLIIDINDNEYMGIKKYPDNITSYPVTIHIYDAIRNGTPLEEELEKIKAEFEDKILLNQTVAIQIIDKRIKELKGENNG